MSINLKLFTLTLRRELLSLVHPDNHQAMAHAFDGAVANVLLDHAEGKLYLSDSDVYFQPGWDKVLLSGQTPAPTPINEKNAAPRGASGKKSPGGGPAPGSQAAKDRAAKAGITRAANKAAKLAAGAGEKPNGSAAPGAARTGFGGAPVSQLGRTIEDDAT